MDLRLLPLALGLWISTALTIFGLGSENRFAIFIWSITLFFLISTSIKRKGLIWWNQVSLQFLILGVLVGLILGIARFQPLVNGPVAQAARENSVVQLTGKIIDDPKRSKVANELDLQTRDFGYFKFQTTQLEFHAQTYSLKIPIQVFISGENFEKVWHLPPGTALQLVGKLSQGDPLRSVAAKLSVTSEIKIIQAPPNYQFLATKFRSGLHQALSQKPADVAGLVPGLALGDNSALTAQLADDMKASGLTHLTAVSGSNVTLLISIVLAISRRLRLTKRTNYLIALSSLAMFVVVVRPQPSVLRASVMGVVMLLALYSRSPKSPLPALTGSIIFLILLDPWLSISYGFALSVFATAGLLLWARALLQTFDRSLPRKIPEWLVVGLVVTISAQLAVFPILVSLGSPISLASLPANLISVPLAGPTMIFGILAALAAQVAMPVSQLIAQLATIPAYGIVWSAKLFANQDWLIIPWPKGAGGVLLAVISITAGVHLKLIWWKLNPAQRNFAITVCTGLVLTLWVQPMSSINNWVKPNWVIASCDVGQGDATVIRVRKSEAIVVDVGGDPELIDKCLSQLKIKKIPLLLLTHFHADHVVGLPGALTNRTIGQVRISPLADPPLTTRFVQDVFADEQITASVLSYPEFLKVGNVELFCIWPKREINQSNNTPNNASVSLLIKVSGISVLLPGDIEPIAQDEILKINGDLKVEVIKVPHHGSRYQSTQFAKATDAELALISVGTENKYGHPATETVFLYESTGAQVLRTDERGSIAIIAKQGKISISAEK